MRKLFLLAAVIVACSKAETPPTDTAAAMAPAPPANLTAADLQGTWTGMSKAAGTDSVTNRWTVTSTSDSTGTITYEGSKTPIALRTVFDADSFVTTSAPFTAPGAKASAPKVMFRSVGRIQNGQMVGTSTTMLATKHDSIMATRTFTATKAP
jgi:hypothetical protein